MADTPIYTQEFRRKVLSLLIHNVNFSEEYLSFIEDGYFPEPQLRFILQAIRKIRQQQEQVIEIGRAEIEAELTDILRQYRLPPEETMAAIDSILTSAVGDEEFIINKLSKWIKRERLKMAISRCIDELKADTELDKVLGIIDDALDVGPGLSYGKDFSDLLTLLTQYREMYNIKNMTRTGIPSFDKALMGGMAPGEVHTIMAPPKAGKTTLAVNMALPTLISDKSVVHITLELPELDILAKYACRLGNMTYDDLITCEESYYRSRIDVLSSLSPSLFVKHYVNKTVDCMAFRSFISRLRSTGRLVKPIGLIIIDYDDLVLPVDRTDNMYEDAGNVYTDMIKLANYFSCPILTLAQPKREAWNKMINGELIGMVDLAHSALKAHKAWSISSLNRVGRGEYVFYVDWVRRGVSDVRIDMDVDLNKAYFCESIKED